MTVFVARHKFQRYNAQPNGVLNVYVVIKKASVICWGINEVLSKITWRKDDANKII